MRHLLMTSSLLAALACGPRVAAEKPPATAPAVASEPSPAVEGDTAPEPAPLVDTNQDSWRPPLPPLVLAETTEAQRAEAQACLERHRVQQPDVRSDELFAAAVCVGEASLPGQEIRLYQHLLATFPNSAEAVEASRAVPLRLEQVGALAPALDAYESYLRRYPKQDDARAMGQRAVCLARALGDQAREEALLDDLVRLYGRSGFSVPSPEERPDRCSEAPSP